MSQRDKYSCVSATNEPWQGSDNLVMGSPERLGPHFMVILVSEHIAISDINMQ